MLDASKKVRVDNEVENRRRYSLERAMTSF